MTYKCDRTGQSYSQIREKSETSLTKKKGIKQEKTDKPNKTCLSYSQARQTSLTIQTSQAAINSSYILEAKLSQLGATP